MPVPLLLRDGAGRVKSIICSIEDNGLKPGALLQPAIIRTPLGKSWKQPLISANSPQRWGAVTPPLAADIYAGAPYIRQLPSGEQMGLGIMQYVQDYDETYPINNNFNPTPGPYGGEGWALWMLHIHPYVKSTQLYQCPSGRRNSTTTFTNTPSGTITFPGHFNYGTNEFVIVCPQNFGGPVAMADIGSPVLLFMIGDSSGTITPDMWRVMNAKHDGDWWNAPNVPREQFARHLGGSNIMYADGHVKWQSQANIGIDPSRLNRPNDRDRWKIPMRPQDDRM